MTIDSLTAFFMWCSVINGALLVFWSLFVILVPDTVYRLQSRWFPISRDSYQLVMYSFLGLFKVMYLVFNLVPFIALKLIA